MKSDTNKKLKILLSYSRLHFDPFGESNNPALEGSSANILARTLFDDLSQYGEVTYIDPTEYKNIVGKSFDLFVGQQRNFYKIVEAVDAVQSILFAVNMHPRARNQLLKTFCNKNGISIQRADNGDLVEEFEASKAINKADYILGVGNINVYNTYVTRGVPSTKIKFINYSQGPILNKKPKPPKSVKNYAYVATELGLRKGFDVLVTLVEKLEKSKSNYVINLVGEVKSSYYKEKLDALLKNKKVTYHGWVDVSSRKFDDILSNTDFLLFPSIEEGQAGTVLDAMRRGVVPIVTAESGIDFSPLGFLEASVESKVNNRIIAQAQKADEGLIKKLKEQTQNYYSEFHIGFEEQLRSSLKDIIETKNALPRLGIVLAIYNKEKTILGLIKRLDKAARYYGNAELHIIFDGCKDNTESIVRGYFKSRTTYPIYYSATPNIFEVKTNNMGLRAVTGKYGVIIQDDNYINDSNCFIEAVEFMEKSNKVVVLGGLAGVNFYPRGTKLAGKGQITNNREEVYWRQDASLDPALQNKIFEVDACMRGPLFLKKSFLEKHGYLDEVYAPLYNDDMDLCFRARKFNYKVYTCLMDVENRSETIANYSPARAKFWEDTIKKNSDLFYSRWVPSVTKDYSWVNRTPVAGFKKDRAARAGMRIGSSLEQLSKATSRGLKRIRRGIK